MVISLNGHGDNFKKIDFDDFWEDYLDKYLVFDYLLEQYDVMYPKVQLPVGEFYVSELISKLYFNSRYEAIEALESDFDNVYSDLKYEVENWVEGDEPIDFLGYKITLVKAGETQFEDLIDED